MQADGMSAAVEKTLTIATGREAGQMLAARRAQKNHERIALLCRLKVRVAQLKIALKRAGLEIPAEFE